MVSGSVGTSFCEDVSSKESFQSRLNVPRSSLIMTFIKQLVPRGKVCSVVRTTHAGSVAGHSVYFILTKSNPLTGRIGRTYSSGLF